MRAVTCKSIITTEADEWSDVESAMITPDGIEIYPAVCKTISLDLDELKAIVAEIEALCD